MRSSVSFGVISLVLAGAIGCAQSERSDLSSPAAPGSLSDSLAAAPGAGYNAGGEWTVALNVPREGATFEFDAVFNQDAGGNITFVDDEGSLVTLTRLGPGTGRIIAYRVSSFGELAECQEEASGTVTIDTQTNTGRGQVVFVEEHCERGTGNVVFTKK